MILTGTLHLKDLFPTSNGKRKVTIKGKKKISKIKVFESKAANFGIKMRCSKRSWWPRRVPKRAFRIGVICANRILVTKVLAKILQRTQKLPQLNYICIISLEQFKWSKIWSIFFFLFFFLSYVIISVLFF